MSEREEGFYWTRSCGAWEVAYYRKDYWLCVGEDSSRDDSYFDEIGERVQRVEAAAAE